MVRSKKSAKFDHEGFIEGLQSLLGALPSASQKQEINNAFTELIGFLTDLRSKFQAIPSIEDVNQVRESLLKLEELFASAEKVPFIAAAVRSDQGSKERNVSASPKKVLNIDVNQVLATLAKLSADEIRSHLDDKAYSKHDLLLIASQLGKKPASGATKKNLADKIAYDIVNQRMRDGLAGRASREAPVD